MNRTMTDYLLSLIAAAVVCSITGSLSVHSKSKEIIKFLCGLFLTVTLLQPFTKIELSSVLNFREDIRSDAAAWSELGTTLMQEQKNTLIKQQLETYILSRASQLNTDLQAEVVLDSSGFPSEVILSGSISPYARQRISDILETDLGIEKGHQIWTG